jgi:hypothetical protein
VTPAVAVIGQLLELVMLAEAATTAAVRVSNLIAERQRAGTDITDADWAELLADRATAQVLLLASIAKRRAAES